MKKISKITLTVAMSVIFLLSIAACQQEKSGKNNAKENGTMNQSEGDKEEEQTSEIDYETMIVRNQQFSDSLTQMDEIKDAKVITYDNSSVAGVTMKDGAELNDEMKEKIQNMIKDTDDTITDVKVTNDEGIIGEMTEAEDRMKTGEAYENLEENIKGIFEKIES